MSFEGAVCNPEFDHARLTGQIARVYKAMSDGKWKTLREIADLTHDGEASISAQLRNLRKSEFGGYLVHKRPRGDRGKGLFEYRLEFPQCGQMDLFPGLGVRISPDPFLDRF